MTTDEILAELDKATSAVEEKGLKSVKVANLKKFNALMREWHEEDKKAGEIDHATRIEKFRAELTDWLEERKRQHEGQLEMIRNVVTSGQAAMRTTLLINGGAAVALLAFVGHLVELPESAVKISDIARAMSLFVGGVLSGAVAIAITYLNNLAASQEMVRTANVLNWFAIVSGLASLGLFCFGGYMAFEALAN